MPRIVQTALTPMEKVMKKLHTEYVTGEITRDEILEYAVTELNEFEYNLAVKLIDYEQAESHLDEKWLSGNYILIDKHIRYFPAMMHANSYFEMLYVYEGNCICSFHESLIDMREGDLIIIPPMMEHSISIYDDSSTVVNLLIDKRSFINVFSGIINVQDKISDFFRRALYGNDTTTALFIHCGDDIRDMIEKMYNKFDLKNIGISRRILSIYFQLLIAYLACDYSDKLILHKVAEAENPLGPLFNFIKQNCSSVSRSQAAQFFGYNSNYLNQLIKRHTDMTFFQVLTEIRMGEASRMLLYSSQSIEDIAIACGYSGKSNFYNAFKKKFGMTPQMFRDHGDQVQ